MHSAEKMGSAFFSMLHILDRLPTGLFGKAQGFATEGRRMEHFGEALRR